MRVGEGEIATHRPHAAHAGVRHVPRDAGEQGKVLAHEREVSTARWGTAAPMVIVPSAPSASASRPGTRLTSIRWRGRSSPSFIRSSSSVPLRTPSSGRGECPGTRAVPPARPLGARRQARALASLCTGQCPAPPLQPRRASPPRARRRPISAASPRARSCTGRSRRIWTGSWRPPRGTRAPDCRRSSPGSCAPTCAAESWSRGAFTCGVSGVRTRWWWGLVQGAGLLPVVRGPAHERTGGPAGRSRDPPRARAAVGAVAALDAALPAGLRRGPVRRGPGGVHPGGVRLAGGHGRPPGPAARLGAGRSRRSSASGRP